MQENRKIITINVAICAKLCKIESEAYLISITMIKTFKFKNFLSFKDEVVFSLVRQGSDDSHKESYFGVQDVELLKSAVVYGANASGKSNFLKAFVFFHNFIVKGLALASLENVRIPIAPFLLNIKTADSPSTFEIEIFNEGKRYIYGFEVSSKKIYKEWLHQYPNKKVLFERIGNKIDSNRRHFKEATSVIEKNIESNVLFLSKLDAFNKEGIAHELVKAIKKINVYPADQKDMILDYALNNLIQYKDEAFEFLKEADFTMNSLIAENKEVSKEEFEKLFPPQLRELVTAGKDKFFLRKAQATHSQYDENNRKVGEIEFDFETQESAGSKNMLGLSLLFVDTLKDGKTLFIDELNASLHPFLCKFVLNKFNSKKQNPKNAQLIFSTHDVSLLDSEILRRDQIFFVEKDKYGSSKLFSLSDLGERKDLSYYKRYFEGRYGALPYIKSNENKWE